MKIQSIICLTVLGLLSACALDDPDTIIQDENFPYRLEIDEKGAALADEEDYDVEIQFADWLGDLPSAEIILEYEISGEGDFANAAIDEIIYKYETDDCEFEREVAFTDNTITIPVDTDLGTVPEKIEIKVAFNLAGDEASDGGFTLTVSGIQSSADVLFNDANEFEYEVLDNDVAGEWVSELDEAAFAQFQEVFGPVSNDLAALSFSEITGEVKYEFEFEEMKIEIELVETEEVSKCENGEVETETENLIVEIEMEYDAEDGEVEFEGKYLNEDGEELDFIVEAAYESVIEDILMTFQKVVDQDQFADGDELFLGENGFTLVAD